MNDYFGKYRGKVVGVPQHQPGREFGRITVSCPAVLAGHAITALPCVPYAGLLQGLCFLPAVGANVWVEFEQGNPEKAIYSGFFWEAKDVPVAPAEHWLQTGKFALHVDDTKGTLSIGLRGPAATSPVRLEITPSSIELAAGSARIRLEGTKVSINGNALEVV